MNFVKGNMKMRQAAFLLICIVAADSQAQATTITVDGLCTLVDAITAADTHTKTGHCIAGDLGQNIIKLTYSPVIAKMPLPEITTELVIHGNGNTITASNDPTVGSVLRVSNSGRLTLRETSLTSSSADFSGLLKNHGVFTLNESAVRSDMADFNGGWLYNYGTITLNNSTISVNSTNTNNRSIANFGTFNLSDSTISGNSAANHDGWGIYNKGTFTLTNSTISGNERPVKSGGIYNYGTFTLNKSTVSVNAVQPQRITE